MISATMRFTFKDRVQYESFKDFMNDCEDYELVAFNDPRIFDCCEKMSESLMDPDNGVRLDPDVGPVITRNGKAVAGIGFCPWCGYHIRWRTE